MWSDGWSARAGRGPWRPRRARGRPRGAAAVCLHGGGTAPTRRAPRRVWGERPPRPRSAPGRQGSPQNGREHGRAGRPSPAGWVVLGHPRWHHGRLPPETCVWGPGWQTRGRPSPLHSVRWWFSSGPAVRSGVAPKAGAWDGDPSFQASLAQAPGGLRRGGRGSGGRVGVHRAGAGPVLRAGSALASWFRFFSSLGSGHGAAAPRVGTDPAPACDSVLCACGGPRGPRAFAQTASGGVEVEGTGGGRGQSWPRVPLSPGAHRAGLTAELGVAPGPPPTIREAHVTPASPRPRFSAVYPHRGGPATS